MAGPADGIWEESETVEKKKRWRFKSGGIIWPPVAGALAAAAAYLLSWVVAVFAEVMDFTFLQPVSETLHANLLWFFVLVTLFDYLRYLGDVLGGNDWLVKPAATALAITGSLWLGGLIVKALNTEIGGGGLEQAGSLLADNVKLVFFLAAILFYFVAVMERVFGE